MTARSSQLTARFERLELDAASFRHRDHVNVAYAMLLEYPFLEATWRYANTIRAMSMNAGATTKFHVTITVAFMALIAERMESSEHGDFEEFARTNSDLFAPDLLDRFYSKQRLQSDAARKIFLMPDAVRTVDVADTRAREEHEVHSLSS